MLQAAYEGDIQGQFDLVYEQHLCWCPRAQSKSTTSDQITSLFKTADVSELQLNLSFSVKTLNMFQVYTPSTGKQEGRNDITEPILWNIFLIMYLPSSHTPLTLQCSSGSLGCMGGETFSLRMPQ